MKNLLLFATMLLAVCGQAQLLISEKASPQFFSLKDATICVDPNDHELVRQSAILLQTDLEKVTGIKPQISSTITAKTAIVIGSADKSALISSLATKKTIDLTAINKQWEAYTWKSNNNQLIIAGSDRRGTAYGVFELSQKIGVSPWYWWADVPVKTKKELYFKKNQTYTDKPSVKYRGIFINDEAPALSGWSKEKFGGFNHLFYEKVFELILRLKGNYLWPAMWGNAFYDDDAANIKMADKYGIVIGTSHHEPLMRAHDEWRRHGSGKWNYDSNKVKLQEFWRGGMKRATNEKIVSVGMRGDGDEPMSRETATDLLERIVKDQRAIIADVTGKPAEQTPQLWALYKEVQDYYDKGMRVPDDVTLLLCDDNWGNLRKLPKPTDKKRKGGYGIYYHFDYVGGPRNYKWLNTNPLPRVWEQMHLAWKHDVKDIWIVNVGDIKPMELPISFFLDYAWNPDKIGPTDIQKYTDSWAAMQFGQKHAKEIGDILAKYAKFNARRKPELLDPRTYTLTSEWSTVVYDYNELLKKAERINSQLPASCKDAFFQLVLHPVKACANLNEMYYNVALNKNAYTNKWIEANDYADKVKKLYENDSLITLQYHQLNGGKWNHMMSQKHIGYTMWQEPRWQRMPAVNYVPADSALPPTDTLVEYMSASVSKTRGNTFIEKTFSGISIDANNYTTATNSGPVKWQILPDHGRTGSAITAFPVTAPEQTLTKNSPHLQYDIVTLSSGDFKINTYHSPSLNFYSSENGLQYAISIDDETPQIISINKEDKNSISGIWNKWVSESIILKTTKHSITKPGMHTVKYWFVTPGPVLQKIVVDFGNVRPSYLGPEQTIFEQEKK
ncbi:MAG: glycosyl hydrolase 115 family protein [Chitinophagaceae bacterium]|nr:glycosyl hydrolase 115 family protein [Chitinophagaceae bacterium]